MEVWRCLKLSKLSSHPARPAGIPGMTWKQSLCRLLHMCVCVCVHFHTPIIWLHTDQICIFTLLQALVASCQTAVKWPRSQSDHLCLQSVFYLHLYWCYCSYDNIIRIWKSMLIVSVWSSTSLASPCASKATSSHVSDITVYVRLTSQLKQEAGSMSSPILFPVMSH